MTSKMVTSVLVDLTDRLLFNFELSMVKMFLFTLFGLSRLTPNSAFSFPRQHNDNQVNSNNDNNTNDRRNSGGTLRQMEKREERMREKREKREKDE